MREVERTVKGGPAGYDDADDLRGEMMRPLSHSQASSLAPAGKNGVAATVS